MLARLVVSIAVVVVVVVMFEQAVFAAVLVMSAIVLFAAVDLTFDYFDQTAARPLFRLHSQDSCFLYYSSSWWSPLINSFVTCINHFLCQISLK